ncbi:hypothetical protein [Streptomyces lydicus]
MAELGQWTGISQSTLSSGTSPAQGPSSARRQDGAQ